MKRFLFIFILVLGFLWAVIGASVERILFGKNGNKWSGY